MNKPTWHLLVCNSFRVSGDPQGVCNKKGAPSLMQYLEEGIADRGIDAQVSSTGCLKVCDRGPAMIVYPQNVWYGNLDEEKLDVILDSIEAGTLTAEHTIA
jgi:(2Fe-2S) ferredoxin